MQLEDWLDDLCVRFIINLPPEELASVERICFQVEEAQWFYEDFIRPLDPNLPSLSLKQFSLRIFQHCPLFSQWSAQHHTTAFAEFLAYKQRVPVRGAILLNDNMDEVVLVKGWKKGANWSFPRGKINKDEDDLDCAIREVYEETGFDVRAAGLVKTEKDMKYIEVTMREQHMRLYVFRGVPRDAYFEPRTRKEISKIEWYKLSELPTQKKKHQHDIDGESLAVNANKFYMVAPFLHPLKKWIGQQKKKETRYSSNLAAPPIIAEDSATDFELGLTDHARYPYIFSPSTHSTLPEVAGIHAQQLIDPSVHLKELLHIGIPRSAEPQVPQPAHGLQVDPQKSNALLALLRNGSTDEPRQHHQFQSQQPNVPQLQSGLFNSQSEPHTTELSLQPNQPGSLNQDESIKLQNQQDLLDLFRKVPPPPSIPSEIPGVQMGPSYPTVSFQRAEDRSVVEQQRDLGNPFVPPATDLPKLTHHTRNLLEAFKIAPQSGLKVLGSNEGATAQTIHRELRQPSFEKPTSPTPKADRPITSEALVSQIQPSYPKSDPVSTSTVFSKTANSVDPQPVSSAIKPPVSKAQNTQVNQSANLLELFTRPSASSNTIQPPDALTQPTLLAELSATPPETPNTEPVKSQNEILAALFKKDKAEQPKRHRSPTSKAGQTGATIDAPLNQPQFDSIGSLHPQPEQSIHRDPLPTHRTLYDPKNPTPVKILSRPDNKQNPSARSPKLHKTNMAPSSPRRSAQPKQKPFQPQILRRPQNNEPRDSVSPSPSLQTLQGPMMTSQRVTSTSPVPSIDQTIVASPVEAGIDHQTSQQSDSHKQTLLSLFGGINTASLTSAPTAPLKRISTSSGMVSPMTQSQIVSPITEEPISTRSRVGSLASVNGGAIFTPQLGGPEARSKPEKRQTAAGDKAFLLGYLGRIASQDG